MFSEFHFQEKRKRCKLLLQLTLSRGGGKNACATYFGLISSMAMPYKNSDTSQQKSRKSVFGPFLNRHQKKLFYTLLSIRPKYHESSK